MFWFALESSTGYVLCSVGHDVGKNSQHCHVGLIQWQQWSDPRTDPSCVNRLRASEGQGSWRADGSNYEVSSCLVQTTELGAVMTTLRELSLFFIVIMRKLLLQYVAKC